MSKGVLGTTAIPPFVSDKPDVIPATSEKQFPHPIQESVVIYPSWNMPFYDAQGVFLRYPLSVVSSIKMVKWNQDGTFSQGPGESRKWEDSDILRPEMLKKYPQLEKSLAYLLNVLEQEAAKSGKI